MRCCILQISEALVLLSAIHQIGGSNEDLHQYVIQVQVPLATLLLLQVGTFWFDWGWTFFSIARRPKGFQFKISIDNEAPEKES